jgi:uncharacterized protein YjbI with pentapeptide repeats
MASNQWQRPAAPQATKQVQSVSSQGSASPQKKTLPTWTGFSGKTVWDWFGLCLLPMILAALAIWVSVQMSEIQNLTNIQMNNDQQQETILQAYLDRMTDFIDNGKLTDNNSKAAIRAIATSQTLTALRRLDGKRRGYLILFLQDAKLIATFNPIVSLKGASIETATLNKADLSNANLGVADLNNINLNNAKLSNTYLNNTNLSNANLSNATMYNTDLVDANLSGANLTNSPLTNANLSGADLSGADLSGADLKGTRIDTKQLAQAKSLKGAIMSNGSRHP